MIEGYTPEALSDSGTFTESIDCGASVAFTSESVSTLSLKSATVVTAYPNPFSDEVTFTFTADKDGLATIDLYNGQLQKVTTILQQQVQKGEFVSYTYNPVGLVSGTYYYQYSLGNTVVGYQLIYFEQ